MVFDQVGSAGATVYAVNFYSDGSAAGRTNIAYEPAYKASQYICGVDSFDDLIANGAATN